MLTRSEIRDILASHYGEVAALARRLGKADQSVWDVLDGKKNSRLILRAAIKRARQLIQKQEAERAVA